MGNMMTRAILLRESESDYRIAAEPGANKARADPGTTAVGPPAHGARAVVGRRDALMCGQWRVRNACDANCNCHFSPRPPSFAHITPLGWHQRSNCGNLHLLNANRRVRCSSLWRNAAALRAKTPAACRRSHEQLAVIRSSRHNPACASIALMGH